MKGKVLIALLGFFLGAVCSTALEGLDPSENAAARTTGDAAAGRTVTGIGGVFFKSADPEAFYAWYENHLGILRTPGEGHVNFCWRDVDGRSLARTVWGPFREDTRYFDPGRRDIMMNFRVADLDSLVARLRAANVTVFDEIEEHAYGRFAWILDLEGNKVELWEPREAGYDWAAVCRRSAERP